MKSPIWGLALACLYLPLAAASLYSQSVCGAHPTPEQRKYLADTRADRQNYDRSEMRGTVRWVPVSFHVISRTSGTGGVDPIVFPTLINRLNRAFAPANMQFFQCSSHDVIANDLYFDLSIGGMPPGIMSEDDRLGNAHDVPNTMNVYFANSVFCDVGSVAGYAFYPGGPERIFIKTGSATTQGLIEHEVGHFFSLYHTHQFYNDPDFAECANGSNGATAGDEILDTPADPRLDIAGMMSGCAYVGTGTDLCGGQYNPNPLNFMSYAPLSCINDFTTGQYNRLAYSAQFDRPNLACPNPNFIPCGTVVSSFPYTQDFEAGNLGEWRNVNIDNFDWSVVSAAPHAPTTGPSSAASGTKFTYIEAQGNTPNRMAILDGPCFDLSMVTNPTVQFRYHMVGANTGSLRLEGSTNGGATWISLFYRFGEQPTGWQTATVSLSPYVSQTTFKMRLVATTTLAALGDIAIDNFKVYAQPCAAALALQVTDIGCLNATTGQIAVLNAPAGATYAWARGADPTTVIGTSASISGLEPGPYQVTVTTPGCTDALGRDVETSNFRLRLTANHPNVLSPMGSLSATYVGGQAPYSLLEWTGPVNGSITNVPLGSHQIPNLPAGDYEVRIVDATGCSVGAWATIDSYVPAYCQCTSSVSVGTVHGFENGLDGWQFCNDEVYFDWAIGTGDAAPVGTTGPTTATAPNAPNGAFAGSKYAYSVSSNYNQAGGHMGAMFLSPCLNFTGQNYPALRFRYHQFRSNGVVTPVTLYLWDAQASDQALPLWTSPSTSSDQWIEVKVDLSIAANTAGKYQLLFSQVPSGSTTNDFALDQVEFWDASASGLSATLNITPSSCGNTGAASVTATCGGNVTYLWSNGATTSSISGLAPNYGIMVTVTCPTASCNRIFFATVPVGEMIPSVSPTHPTMAGLNNGSLDLEVGGGQAPYTYSWTGPSGFTATTQDISNLSPGTYNATITDSKGCTKTAQGVILDGTCPNIVSTFPLDESFELDFGNWVNPTGEAASHSNWLRLSGPTPSTSSGPASAFHGTYYAYMNSAGATPGSQAHLISYCIDLRRSTAASFTFDYHAWHSNPSNSDMGDLYLDITTNQGSTWTTLATILTVRTASNQWYTYPAVSLNAYAGKVVQLRFRGVMGVVNRSDIALDRPRITGTFYKDDAGQMQMPEEQLSLYPNPSHGQLNLDYAAAVAGTGQIAVMDLSGQVLRLESRDFEEGLNSISMDLSDLSAGLYLLQVTTPGSKVVRRFVVSH